MPDDLDSVCFLVAPIGSEGSDTRKRSDNVRDHVVKPAADRLGLSVVRADEIATPGEITHQVIDHVLRAKLVVADLTDSNPNVFYELALRHAVRLPYVQIAERGQPLPFDVGQIRTIFVDTGDLGSAARCIADIESHARTAIDGPVHSPVATAINVQSLQGGSPLERVATDLLAGMEALGHSVSELRAALIPPASTAQLVGPPDERQRLARLVDVWFHDFAYDPKSCVLETEVAVTNHGDEPIQVVGLSYFSFSAGTYTAMGSEMPAGKWLSLGETYRFGRTKRTDATARTEEQARDVFRAEVTFVDRDGYQWLRDSTGQLSLTRFPPSSAGDAGRR